MEHRNHIEAEDSPSITADGSSKISSWIEITQDMIDRFAAATLDADPLHIDPAWAREHGPFGHTIAFGFLTMSLLTHLFHEATKTDSLKNPSLDGLHLNYGFDRLRLITPVPTGSRIRGHFRETSRSLMKTGHVLMRYACLIEVEHHSKPALSGTWLAVWVPPESREKLAERTRAAGGIDPTPFPVEG